MSDCEEIATTINRLVKAGYIAKAQELLELSLDDYFVLQLAMFADKQVNAYTTIAAWKQAGLRLPAEDTDEFFPYRDSPSVTEEQLKAEVDKMKEELRSNRMNLPSIPPPPPIPRQQAELHTIKIGGRTIALPAPDNRSQRCDHLGKPPLVPFSFRQRLLAFFMAGDATPTQARYFYVQCARFIAGINETRETYAKLQASIVRRDQGKASIFDVTEDSLCIWNLYAPINMIFTSCMMLVAGRVLYLYGMCHWELSSIEREQMVMKSWRDRIIKANPEKRRLSVTADSATQKTDAADAYDAFRTGKQIWNDIIRTGGSPEFRETKKKEALRYFDQAIASGYDTSEVFSLRGSCLNDLGFYFDALEDYDKAIQKQPSQAIANNYFMRSIIKDSLFDFEGSVADLKEAIRLSKLDNDDNRFWNGHSKSMGFDSQTAFYEWSLPREEMILFRKRTYTDEKIADELKKIKRR